MGKAKRLKRARKEQEQLATLRKKEKIKKGGKFFITVLISFGILTGGFFGGQKAYKYFKDNKQSLSSQSSDKKGEKVTQETASYKIGERQYSRAPEMLIDENKEYVASFKTNQGDFKVKLYAKDAPKTVNNFVFLAREKFYDGLIFHRIITDFMIQGGDPQGNGSGGPGYKFEDEINSHKLVRGVLAMANSGKDTNGSQFFIVTKDATDWLDGKHTAFGEVTEGLDVVMKIEKVEVGENDLPKSEVKIESVTIEEK